jgi:enolase
MKINKIKGIEIFDSRGKSTLEVHCYMDNGQFVSASVPSGAITGNYEASVVDVAKSIANIDAVISPSLVGQDPVNQENIDKLMISIDGTANKENLGGNTILGVSMAVCRAGAIVSGKTLVNHLRDISNIPPKQVSLRPMFNVINGGAHADNNLSFQEFMIVPLSESISFTQKMAQGAKVFSQLKKRLEEAGKTTNVGDEGGFAPEMNSNEEAIEILVEVIEESGFKPGVDFAIALDIAANGIPDLMIATYPKAPLSYYQSITNQYPIISIEDPFNDNAWSDWTALNQDLGSKISIVGDDLFSTNPGRLKTGIEKKAANSISIKPNQIGTIWETLETINIALSNNIDYQISHRSGETEDTFISDLALATYSKYLKAGAPNRGERIAKYNQIIRLEADL